MHYRRLLVTGALVASVNTAWAGDRAPGWVNGSAELYPSELYIVGMGSGDERSDAETRARAAVSAVFSVHVSAQTAITTAQTEVTEGGKTRFSATQAVVQDAKSTTDRVLEGVAIAESWQDPTTKRIYALAVLNRKKAAVVLRDKLGDLETAVKPQVVQLAKATEPLRRAGAGFRIQALAKNRDNLIADLRVIQPGADTAGEADWSTARRDADAAVRALQVSLRVAGSENARAIQTGVVKSLNALGICTVDGTTPPDIAVAVNLDLAVSGPREGWYYARLTATATVTDPKTGTQILQFDASVRPAASEPGEASHRAADAVAKKVAENLQPALQAFFAGQ